MIRRVGAMLPRTGKRGIPGSARRYRRRGRIWRWFQRVKRSRAFMLLCRLSTKSEVGKRNLLYGLGTLLHNVGVGILAGGNSIRSQGRAPRQLKRAETR